jgi:hypothetical protein
MLKKLFESIEKKEKIFLQNLLTKRRAGGIIPRKRK